MNIIKEYALVGEKTLRFSLRTNTYAHSLDFFERLWEEAKRDFPWLDKNDVEVVHYGGIRYKHIFGIEFTAKDIPDGYTDVGRLENTL